MPAVWPLHDIAQATHFPVYTYTIPTNTILTLAALLASCPIFAVSHPEWKEGKRHTSESRSNHTSQLAQSSSSCTHFQSQSHVLAMAT